MDCWPSVPRYGVGVQRPRCALSNAGTTEVRGCTSRASMLPQRWPTHHNGCKWLTRRCLLWLTAVLILQNRRISYSADSSPTSFRTFLDLMRMIHLTLMRHSPPCNLLPTKSMLLLHPQRRLRSHLTMLPLALSRWRTSQCVGRSARSRKRRGLTPKSMFWRVLVVLADNMLAPLPAHWVLEKSSSISRPGKMLFYDFRVNNNDPAQILVRAVSLRTCVG